MRFTATKHLLLYIALCALLVASTSASATLRLGSWNLLHLGWNNHKNYAAVAAVAAQFDLIAVQELMKPEALDTLARHLQKRTGVKWKHIASGAVGSTRYKEHYGFIWRTDKARYVGGAISYIDDRDQFEREPFSAAFERLDNGKRIALGTVHIMFGKSRSDRRPEIKALASYWQWLEDTYPDADLHVLTGDMNMPPSDPGWQKLDQSAHLLLTTGKSTLSTTAGKYASLYDQIIVSDDWHNPRHAKGVFVYPKAYGWGWDVRDQISDHLPVYLILGKKKFTRRTYGRLDGLMTAAKAAGARLSDCIRLNKASAQRLAELPHIGPARAKAIIDGRPWKSIKSLTAIRGLSANRVGDIVAADMLCELAQ